MRCGLDFLSAGARVGNIVIQTTVTASGQLALNATGGYTGVDANLSDNTIVISASASPPVPATPSTPTVTVGVTRIGTAKANTLVGTRFADTLRGLGGNDLLRGRAGGDRLFGGTGADRLDGGAGADRLFGEAGADRLEGGPGTDLIDGGGGPDRIYARDKQRDTIRCGPGIDTVSADRIDTVARDCERVTRLR